MIFKLFCHNIPGLAIDMSFWMCDDKQKTENKRGAAEEEEGREEEC